jgi:hypothetical protein
MMHLFTQIFFWLGMVLACTFALGLCFLVCIITVVFCVDFRNEELRNPNEKLPK